MNKKKQPRLSLFFLVACSILGVTTSCQIHASSHQRFPDTLLLTQDDVPTGWVLKEDYSPEVSGAITREIRYTPDVTIPWKGISHQIAVYPSEKDAIEAFSEWEIEVLPPVWQPDPATTFVPQAENDSYYLKSSNFIINGIPVKAYRLLQRHKNLIILVITNVEDSYLTLEQFEESLEKLDTKLQAYQLEE